MLYYVIIGVLCVIIILYLSLEFHYFLRMILSVIIAKYFKKPIHILDETCVTGICLPTDMDTFWFHMNNARFLRELDFIRSDFFIRSSLIRTLNSEKGSIFQGATTIKYRRFIKPFSIYRVLTKIIFWEEKAIYFEHRFINRKDNFVYAIVLSKQSIIDADVEKIMNKLLKSSPNSNAKDNYSQKPNMPPELAKWIEYSEISSKKLRNDN